MARWDPGASAFRRQEAPADSREHPLADWIGRHPPCRDPATRAAVALGLPPAQPLPRISRSLTISRQGAKGARKEERRHRMRGRFSQFSGLLRRGETGLPAAEEAHETRGRRGAPGQINLSPWRPTAGALSALSMKLAAPALFEGGSLSPGRGAGLPRCGALPTAAPVRGCRARGRRPG